MEENLEAMEAERRPLRADAERNRQRLIESATAIFSERGLEVGVGEIAERAGVGRGTLFRNFPSKEDLIAAVVVERIRESVDRGRALLSAPDPGEALFSLIDQAAGRSQTDRALFDALDD
jgi:AcrR family transcriptional regulator